MRRAILLLLATMLLAGCPDSEDSRPEPAAAPASANAPAPEMTAGDVRVAETAEAVVTEASGGAVTLPNGARLEVPAHATAADVTIRLKQAAAPADFRDLLVSDVYSLSSSARAAPQSRLSLRLPYDPDRLGRGASEDELAGCVLYDGQIIAPVASRVDKANHVVVIDAPDVTAPGPGQRLMQATPYGNLGLPLPNDVWYAVHSSGQDLQKSSGVLEVPGHVFRIIPKVDAPRDFQQYVSATLQEAWNDYNKTYTSQAGKAPFAHLSPQRRMKVYLGNYKGTNGEYRPWTWDGYILVDVTSGQSNRGQLRDTLYHEMFHAVQDVYSNMFVGGNVAMWWYEASAEWAGLRSRGLSFADMVKSELAVYPEVLSVPVQQSRSYRDGLLSYGASLLVAHVERVHPGHVHEMLKSWATFSGQLYERMVKDGRLAETYPQFVHDTILAAYPDHPVWSQATLFDVEAETRVFSVPEDAFGQAGTNPQRISRDEQRFTDHRFAATAGPLTTRFFRVHVAPVRQARTLEIKLTRDGMACDQGWVLTSNHGAMTGMVRLQSAGTTVRGLGRSCDEVWIACFNSDPQNAHRLEATLGLRPTTGWQTWVNASGGTPYSFCFKPESPVDPSDPLFKQLHDQWAMMTLKVAGRTYYSYGRFNKDLMVGFDWPSPALKPGTNDYQAVVQFAGQTVTFKGKAEVKVSTDYFQQKVAAERARIAELKPRVDKLAPGARSSASIELPKRYLALGDACRGMYDFSGADAAWEQAAKYNPTYKEVVKQRRASVRLMQADLDGYLAILGMVPSPVDRLGLDKLAFRAIYWKNDLALAWTIARKHDEQRRKEGGQPGSWSLPEVGTPILK